MSEKLKDNSAENLNVLVDNTDKNGDKLHRQKERESIKANNTGETESRAEVERALKKTYDSRSNKSTQPKRSMPPQTIIKKATKQQKKDEFNKTMTSIQSEMSSSERVFSKIIHNPAIEKASDVVGNTIARPVSLLAGSLSALILTALIYVIARHYGYALSGTEFIAAFIVGWIIGLLLDWLRTLISGNRVV